MNIFRKMQEYDYEELVLCQDKSNGLKAVIAIHDINNFVQYFSIDCSIHPPFHCSIL